MWSYCHCWGVLRHMGQYSMRIYSASCGFFVCHCWLFAVQVLWRGNDLLEWTGLTFLSSLLGNLKLFALIRLVADLHNFPGSALALESGVRCALIFYWFFPWKALENTEGPTATFSSVRTHLCSLAIPCQHSSGWWQENGGLSAADSWHAVWLLA